MVSLLIAYKTEQVKAENWGCTGKQEGKSQ